MRKVKGDAAMAAFWSILAEAANLIVLNKVLLTIGFGLQKVIMVDMHNIAALLGHLSKKIVQFDCPRWTLQSYPRR